MSLSNPLNLLLIPTFLYLLYKHFVPSLPTPRRKELPNKYDEHTYNWMPAKHPSVICYKDYTAHQLSEYDGKKGDRILLAILNHRGSTKEKVDRKGERTVFDVSAGRNFYGPDGVYGNFAGRDASRGMAKQSFDEDMLTPLNQPLDDLQDLTPSEVDNMKGWHQHFSNKYTICGRLVESKKLTYDIPDWCGPDWLKPWDLKVMAI